MSVFRAAHGRPDLDAPVNSLERDDDPSGGWRRHVNAALAGAAYRRLFDRIDRLVLLAAPDFAVVREWRIEQERRAAGVLTNAEVDRFVGHFERLTRNILGEMPERAGLVLRLAHDGSVVKIVSRRVR